MKISNITKKGQFPIIDSMRVTSLINTFRTKSFSQAVNSQAQSIDEP